MSMPLAKVKMHVIIPTKNRANTLEWSLKTALNQDYPDYTVWVSDNFSEDNTKEIAFSYKDSRVKYINPEERLSMSSHWEFALDHIEEGYVMILGDDDGLYPGAVDKAAALLQKHGLDAISWAYGSYSWPGVGDLYNLPLSDTYMIRNVGELLEQVKDDLGKIRLLPGFYWGFINIRLYHEIKKRDGLFFNSSIPDYYSASVLSGSLERFIYSEAAFSITGTSLNSEGGSFHDPEKYGKKRGNEFMAENNMPVHPKVIIGKDGVSALADAYLQAQHRASGLPEMNMNKLLQKGLHSIANCGSKQKYEDSIGMLREVAKKNNLSAYFETESANNPFNGRKSLPKKGSFSVGLNAIRFLPEKDYNVRNVYEASILASQILPALKYRASILPGSWSYYAVRCKGLLIATYLTFFTRHSKSLLRRYLYSFVGK